MKKILLSLLTIALVSAVAVGATRAYFSDTETSAGNTITAGTLDLKVGGQDGPAVAHVTQTNIVPAAPWTTQRGQGFHLTNAGSVPGTVTATVKNLVNYENGCNAPEIVAGDVTCGATDGELGGLLIHTTWTLNQAPWGSFGPAFASLNAAAGVPVTDANFHLNPGESKDYYFQMYWDTSPSDNLAQGDGVAYDVEFVLNQ
jgi:spore coat-associated protein N